MIMLLGRPPNNDPVPGIAVASFSEDSRASVVVAFFRHRACRAANIGVDDELPGSWGGVAPRYVAQHLVEILQLLLTVISPRDYAPVLLEHTKVEVAVHIRVHDERWERRGGWQPIDGG